MSSDKSGVDKAQDKAKEVGKDAQDAGKKAGDELKGAGKQAENKAKDTYDGAKDKADSASKDAQKKSKRSGGGDGPSKEDKDKLKVAGAAVAVAAALIFGGVKVYKSRKSEPEEAKDDVQEKTQKGFNWFGKKADQGKEEADKRFPDSKNKAVEIKDSVAHNINKAADQTKSTLNDVSREISGSTKDARNKVNEAGSRLEEKSLRASRDSDRAVREAYFNAADRANAVVDSGHDKAHHGKEKSGNIFDNIGHWFSHRKDEASRAATDAKKQVQGKK